MLWPSCEGQTDVWEMFSDNSYLSAILDRQGLQVAAPIDLRTKKAESFSPQLSQGFWHKLKKKNSKIVVLLSTVETKSFKEKEVVWQQYHLCMDVAQQIFGGKHFLISGPESRKICWLKKVQDLQKKVPLPMGPPAWQVRTVLGDCISRATVVPAQAPQYRQCALVSEFMDLANLCVQEEAALAANWIKDRPEWLKLQNPYVGPPDGPIYRKVTRKSNCRRPLRNQQMRICGLKEQLILHGNPSAIARDFSPHVAVLRRHFLPNMHFQCCMLLRGTLGRDFDIFAASGESTAWVLLWKTRSRPIRVRVCPGLFWPA